MKNVESKILQKIAKVAVYWWRLMEKSFNYSVFPTFDIILPGHVIQDTNHDAVLHANCTHIKIELFRHGKRYVSWQILSEN